MLQTKEAQNILVVDDEELIINLLADYFSDLGYRVTAVKDAEKAIEALSNGHKFSLVLTDINLPGKSGLDLLKIVKETKEDLPVVLLTGMKTLDTAISALKSGAQDYITKPFDLKTIRKVVEKVLKVRNRSIRKVRIYEKLEQLKLSFRFKTCELDPDAVSKELSGFLYKMQFGSEEDIKQFELVFTETLINSMEHGNLELPSSLKSNDLLEMAEFEELKETRLQDPHFANRYISIIFECNTEIFSFTVRDEGPGFDWKKYINPAHKIISSDKNPYGRGFMIIQHIIDEVYFNQKGNTITLIKHRENR